LDRAARILALVLATGQAVGVAFMLKTTEGDGGDLVGVSIKISVPLVTLTLVGGACVSFVAAGIISRHGLRNGVVALVGASFVRMVVESAAQAARMRTMVGRHLEPRDAVLALVAMSIAAIATWAAIGRGRARGAASRGRGRSLS
jgi:preprotein translocase subunit SecY